MLMRGHPCIFVTLDKRWYLLSSKRTCLVAMGGARVSDDKHWLVSQN